MDVTLDRNYIEVNDQRIDRPASMAPSQWLEFWKHVDGGHQAAIDLTNRPKAQPADHIIYGD